MQFLQQKKQTFTKWWSQLRFIPGWEMEDSVQVVTYNWFSVVVWHYFSAPLYIEKWVLSPSKFSIYSILCFLFFTLFLKSWRIIVKHLRLPQCRRLWRLRVPKRNVVKNQKSWGYVYIKKTVDWFKRLPNQHGVSRKLFNSYSFVMGFPLFSRFPIKDHFRTSSFSLLLIFFRTPNFGLSC